jgi:hypothetical protein
MSGITVKLDILASFLPCAVDIETKVYWFLSGTIPALNIKMQAFSGG